MLRATPASGAVLAALARVPAAGDPSDAEGSAAPRGDAGSGSAAPCDPYSSRLGC